MCINSEDIEGILKFKEEDLMEKLPLEKRYLLTIKETVAFFGIGEKKLRQIVRANDELPFVLRNGTKYMIKRELFAEFMRETNAV